MPLLPLHQQEPTDNARCFGLRIENHLLQVAIATPREDGRYRIEIDEVECELRGGWLRASNAPLLAQALEDLVDRHEMRRQTVAVSLDGDFCVTRVTMGTTEQVDAELRMQANRVPRYLQLGPGEKVTGGCRQKIAATVDYAVTGVVNRTLIQLIYDALRHVDIDATWVEPSLVSMARLVEQAQITDEPIMIADSTGTQWDVGIACDGRLLLDYRPASANSEEAFRDALDGHISRLQRFCHRHRGVVTGELSRLMICGTGEKPRRAVEIVGDSLGLQPEILRVPDLEDIYVMDEAHRHPRSVPAVATVLPLLIDVAPSDVPDMLTQVRRAPELPWARRMLRNGWPVVAAALILCISYGMVSSQRRALRGSAGRAEMQAQLEAAEVKIAKLSTSRQLLGHLQRIERLTAEADWNDLLSRITQCLPDLARLTEYRVEPDGQVLLEGVVVDEAIVYELVSSLRQIPGVTETALQGTSPDESVQGTRFVVRLRTSLVNPAAVLRRFQHVMLRTSKLK